MPEPSTKSLAMLEQRSGLLPFLRLLWAFSRPHTIIGTTLSVVALGVMAAVLPSPLQLTSGGNPALATISILLALIPSLCANIYIVGLNQLTDINIDRINKPNLPLASGRFSFVQATWIVAIMGGLAIILAAIHGPILLATVIVSMTIGTCYSLPPIRLKRFPFWAAFCIFGVRGIVVNLGFYLYFSNLFGGFNQFPLASLFIPPEVWALSQFVILFTLAIAFLKDIPDLEGDRIFHVLTLTVRLGAGRVFKLSSWILTLCYLLLISYAALGLLPSANPYFLILSHLGLLALFWKQSGTIDTSNLKNVRQYYQFIWKLFFLEYILFPLALVLPHH